MSSGSPKAIRVLFVEDAFDQALLVKAFLGSMGDFQVVHSQDGDHAARLVREQEWDLLITDLNLPGLDGFELCRIAKAAHPTLPVLAVTGYTGAHYQEQAFRAGATDLLTKPLNRDEFVAKVAELAGLGSGAGKAHVLAVEGLVGDAEMGCGGSLLLHRRGGAEIHILPLCRDELDPAGVGLAGARRAAQALGADLILEEAALDDTQLRAALIERVIRELRPSAVYLPAMDDVHPSRREAFRIGKMAAAQIPSVLGYQTATTGLDFRPGRFTDVGAVMVEKMEALAAYQSTGLNRLDLAPRLAQAYARYWGRFERFGEVEAFELVSR